MRQDRRTFKLDRIVQLSRPNVSPQLPSPSAAQVSEPPATEQRPAAVHEAVQAQALAADLFSPPRAAPEADGPVALPEGESSHATIELG